MYNEFNYLSSELLLNVVQKEFEFESERNKGLQNRSGIFISFIGVIMTVFPSYINIKRIVDTHNVTIGQTGILLLYLVLIILLFTGLIISLILFSKTLNTKQYRRLKTNGFNKNNAIFVNNQVAVELMNDYKIALEHNIQVNDKKANIFGIAYKILTICIVLIPIIITIKAFI
ncbi:hypothetical protein [Clostridium estertheticum]|uniref:Uncharacterized protein n=1 Tax=Clostridium estertheticum TaxID=238834 RepID=A0A7Y3SYA5_9CLOT|nr:hypothetical protein [Clostridium estertheticum]NNU77570.1 hypothetical protein [Clostridium estertheticum]WBL48487.1 hypothetical protein LOR37_07470 [Clostridium estertheticum]